MTNHERYNTSTAALWASAFVIMALIIMQAGKLPGNAAYAEMSSSNEAYTLLTTDAGKGDDAAPYELLYVLDNRDQFPSGYSYQFLVRNSAGPGTDMTSLDGIPFYYPLATRNVVVSLQVGF